MKRAVDEVLPADLKAVPFPIVLFLFAVIKLKYSSKTFFHFDTMD